MAKSPRGVSAPAESKGRYIVREDSVDAAHSHAALLRQLGSSPSVRSRGSAPACCAAAAAAAARTAATAAGTWSATASASEKHMAVV